MVVETDWPVSCTGVSLSDSSAISAAGQSQWVSKIRDALSGLSGGHGLGIVYWEPGWIGNANLGSGCSVSYYTLSIPFLYTNSKDRIIFSWMVQEIRVAASQCSQILCRYTLS